MLNEVTVTALSNKSQSTSNAQNLDELGNACTVLEGVYNGLEYGTEKSKSLNKAFSNKALKIAGTAAGNLNMGLVIANANEEVKSGKAPIRAWYPAAWDLRFSFIGMTGVGLLVAAAYDAFDLTVGWGNFLLNDKPHPNWSDPNWVILPVKKDSMKFYRYIFYYFYRFFNEISPNDIPFYSAALLISTFNFFNLISLFSLFNLVDFALNKPNALIILICLLIINLIYFFYFNKPDEIIKEIKYQSNNLKKVIFLGYLIVSIILLIVAFN